MYGEYVEVSRAPGSGLPQPILTIWRGEDWMKPGWTQAHLQHLTSFSRVSTTFRFG